MDAFQEVISHTASGDMIQNPVCKKPRGSHVLLISCAHCGNAIAKYHKVGESNLVKMYHERIAESSIDLADLPGALFCPECGAQIATRYTTKPDRKEAYRLVPSAFHKKKIR